MKKLFLSLVVMLFCSATVFAQEESVTLIASKAEFRAIDGTGNYKLMADIDLGDLGTVSSAIIDELEGTFDGNGYTIRYTAESDVSEDNFGLFGSVSGTVKNLNITASATITGAADNVGLLCGSLTGRIENCRAINCVINSTIPTNNGKGIHVGTLAGSLNTSGTNGIYYCTVIGNVTGNGSVGGLVGYAERGIIKGCSFTGSVTGIPAGEHNKPDGVGGICGQASASVDLSFCFADATMNANANACGIICGVVKGNSSNHDNPDVANVYAEGIVNNDTINTPSEVTNSTASQNSGLYYENCNGMTAQQIVDALNAAKGDDANFYFVVIENKVRMVIGSIVCEAPRNLKTERVGTTGYTYNITWEAPAGVDNSFLESSHGNYQWTIAGTANTTINSETGTVGHNVLSLQHTLTGDALTYRVAIQTVCGNTRSGEIAVVINKQNDCKVQALQVSDIAYTSATATWEGYASKYIVRLMKDLQQVSETETENTTISFSNLVEGGDYTLTVIANCASDNETVVEGNNAIANFTTKRLHFTTAKSGQFGDPTTWVGGVVPSAPAEMTIAEGHTITLHGDLLLTTNYKIVDNKGVLAVYNDAQLINTTETNVPGIVEIVALSADSRTGLWEFIGAPFENNYNLGTILPVTGSDISVSKYDYNTANWSDSWADVYTTMSAGEGYFAWPFYNGSTVFTTYGDVCTWDNENERWERNNYDFNRPTTATKLNNGNVTITKDVQSVNGGRWMALTNPYPAKLDVSLFVADNDNVSETIGEIQGKGIYRLVNIAMGDNNQSFQFEPNGEIAMCEGFFVNLASGNSVTFTKTQLTDYPTAKSQVAPREFVELSLVKGNHNSKLYFAHNQEAEQNYDIFDANKLFALGEVAEPYFVTDGIALVKEEVAELPYYATMNVRSFANDTVSFVVNNIPEGLAVSIIDGENVIDMVEGGVYTTEILTGENADRFKVLIKKSVSISDVEELEVNITNNNRHISIATTETDLQVEVYNALGQKVLSTKDRNFTLNQVSAGAYLIKAFNNKASKTQKILVK